MMDLLRKSSRRVSALLLCALLLLSAAPASVEASTGERAAIPARALEPVIVTGLTNYHGVPTSEICVYRYSGSEWEQIPFQIDEKDATGQYVASEDGILDANDELVFMASDLGVFSTVLISDTVNVETPWYRVSVSNPLDPTASGWVYIVRSSTINCDAGQDYASFDQANSRIVAQNYTLGWATSGHNGFEYLSMFNGTDVLDRTKLRAKIGLFTVTENMIPLQTLELVKDGPVRVIARRGTAMTFGYASIFVTTTPVELDAIPGNINEVTISFDLASGVTGTYYNENVPNGVPIDGVPDNVPPTLTKAWRQTSLASGTIVEVAQIVGGGGTHQHYYKDNKNCGLADTGDKECWGDSGFTIINPVKEKIVATATRYILPGSQPNVGDTYYNYNTAPLTVNAAIDEAVIYDHHIYLPIVIR
jgi:hypothetical protein